MLKRKKSDSSGRKNKEGELKILRGLADELLDKGISIRIKTGGYSMYPAIRPGETVLIKPIADKDSLKPGMIIAWKREGDMVVHRLIHINETEGQEYYLTRGDSSPLADIPVSFDMIAGRVEAVYKKNQVLRPVDNFLLPKWMYRFNRLLARVIQLLKKGLGTRY